MRWSYLFCASILLLMLLPALAVRAEVNWDFAYEGDVLPKSDNSILIQGVPTTRFFTAQGLGNTQSVANGEYNYNSINSQDTFQVISTFLNDPLFTLNSDTGYTFEWRIKVNEVDVFGSTNATIMEVDETREGVDRYWGLRLFRTAEGQNRANLLNFDGGSALVDVAPGYNTYRVTVLGTEVLLYLNDNANAVATIPTGTFQLDGVRWGGYWASDADVTVDYIRFYSGGVVPPGSVSLLGDFNADGKVDAADYTVWRDNLGTPFNLNGNGNESGGSANVVDSADYDLWKSNFGSNAGVGANASTAVVPEPAALILVILSAATVGATSGLVRLNRRATANQRLSWGPNLPQE